MKLNKKNNIKLKIENVLTSSGNLLIVDKGDLLGENFSNNSSKNFLLTLCRFSGTTIEQMEIVKVIAKNGNNLTLERAVEPCPLNYNSTETSQIAYEFLAGDFAFMNLTAGEINQIGEEIANLKSSKIDKTDQTITKQGNNFNGRNQLVQLKGDGKLPVLDGSNLTNLKSEAQNLMVKMVPGEKIGKVKQEWLPRNQNNGAKTGERNYRNTNQGQSIRIPTGNIRNLRLKVFCRLTNNLNSGVRMAIYINSYKYTDFNNLTTGNNEIVLNLDQYNLTPGQSYTINFYNNAYHDVYVETSNGNNGNIFRYVLEYEEYSYSRNNTEEAFIPVRLGYKENEEKGKIYEYKAGDEGEITGIAKGVFQGYTDFQNLVEGEEIEVYGQNIFGISFSHQLNSIKKFIFKGKKVGNGNLKLDIYDILENGNVDIAGGSKISKTINFSQIPSEFGEFIIELDNNFTVVPNKKYAAILSYSDGNSNNKVIFKGGIKKIEEINVTNELNYSNSSTSFTVEKSGLYIFFVNFNSTNYNSYNQLTIQKNSSQIKQFSNGTGGNFFVYLSQNDRINISGSNSYNSTTLKCNLVVTLVELGFHTSTDLNGIFATGKSLYSKVENTQAIQPVNVITSGTVDIGEHNLEIGKDVFVNNLGVLNNSNGVKIGQVISENEIMLYFRYEKNFYIGNIKTMVTSGEHKTITITHGLTNPKNIMILNYNKNALGNFKKGIVYNTSNGSSYGYQTIEIVKINTQNVDLKFYHYRDNNGSYDYNFDTIIFIS